MTNHFDVIIIGAGAAGLMCAQAAGQRGRKTLLLERATKVGKKILISGGGRCNFTNLWTEPDNYISQNAHFCKSALSRFTQHDFIELVQKHKIAYHEKTLGQLFCDGSAKEIVDMLLAECKTGGVQIQTNCDVQVIEKNDAFQLETSTGTYRAQSLVIATGGLSIPKMGATDFGYRIAQQFDIHLTRTDPALVPFTFNNQDHEDWAGMAGVAAFAEVTCRNRVFREALLVTHRGLSGPAILQISSYWQPGDAITINLLPDLDLLDSIRGWQTAQPKAHLHNLLSDQLSKRLSKRILELAGLDKPINQLTAPEIEKVVAAFQGWHFKPGGTEGYRKAEVTRGGVDTDELSSKTFAAKKVPGLYFIGEVIDVTGWLGGFNFQWAWASGYCAGQFV